MIKRLVGIAVKVLTSASMAFIWVGVVSAGESELEGSAGKPVPADKPNILLILVDDLGLNDISYNPLRGDKYSIPPVKTPQIDRIAREGVSFLTAYASNATCAPSRAALMTGRYQHRFGFEFNPGVSGPYAKFVGTREHYGLPARYFPENLALMPPLEDIGMPVEEQTIAELLRAGGYSTAHFGKWHLGNSPRFLPHRQGFDLSVGFNGGASLYAPVGDTNVVSAPLTIEEGFWDYFRYEVHKNGEPVDATAYQTDLWADEAVEFIREHNKSEERPFFAYLAFNAPHNPLQAPKAVYEQLSHIEDHTERVYYAMVVSLDQAIGRVLSALEETNQEENTLVIFASDNGGADYTGIWTHNQPFRGFKGSFWEGGVRIPLFMRWPAMLPTGMTVSRPVSLIDLFATLSSVAKIDPPMANGDYDGKSLLPYVKDGNTQYPHQTLFWRAGDTFAVRKGDLKLITAKRPAPGRVWLYDLSKDPTEQHNLGDTRPGDVDRLRSIIEEHFEAMKPPLFPMLFEMPIRADRPPESDEEDVKLIDYMNYPA